MAPTKAMARYAVTTLSLPAKVMRSFPPCTPPRAHGLWLTESLFWKKSALLSLAFASRRRGRARYG